MDFDQLSSQYQTLENKGFYFEFHHILPNLYLQIGQRNIVISVPNC